MDSQAKLDKEVHLDQKEAWVYQGNIILTNILTIYIYPHNAVNENYYAPQLFFYRLPGLEGPSGEKGDKGNAGFVGLPGTTGPQGILTKSFIDFNALFTKWFIDRRFNAILV